MINNSKVIITEYDNDFLIVLLDNNKAVDIKIVQNNNAKRIGDIYLGEVINKKDNIESSFINISKDFNVYLKGLEYKNGINIPIMIKKITSGNKQDVATDKLSIPGIYNVIFPSKNIKRTNAKFVDDSSIENEKEYLNNIFNDIIAKKDTRTKGSLLYRAEHELINTVFSYRFDIFDEIVTDSFECYEIFKDFINRYKDMDINIPVKLTHYKDDQVSIKALYSLSKHIDDALSKKVYLKSGAYILFDYTEALTVIDVNSGSTNFKGSKDEVALLVNKESFDEIMHQIRLRNLSGIIIVDFINLKNNDLYEDLKNHIDSKIKDDNRKAKSYGFTNLGLLEMTRDRVDKPLHEMILNRI